MLAENVGCLIVNDDQGDFAGLITERDIAHYVAASPEDAATASVSLIMVRNVISCAPGTPASVAREIMTAHHIRHLPIVEGGAVVGILSSRDVLDQQLLEDRAAAKEVAMLSNCLKSIDLNEAAEIVTIEAPKLFEAKSCVLCLYPNDGKADPEPELTASNRCPLLEGGTPKAGSFLCASYGRCSPSAQSGHNQSEVRVEDTVARECQNSGGRAPRVVIPLDIVGLKESSIEEPKRLFGYLCMCGMAPSGSLNSELLSYKAKLTREILNAHLTNATRYQQARLTSMTDILTGVGSRRLLEDKLQAECIRAKRYKRPFAVAIIDLDHFKLINDVLGHATGDEAIRRLAACMKSQKRAPDVLARYGGDEFVVLMPETTAVDSRILLERIRIKVKEIELGSGSMVESGDPRPGLSMSCGIAECDLENDDARDVMRRADMALYEAKNAGRDRVVLWDKSMNQRSSAGDLENGRIKRLQQKIIGLSEKAEKMFMESIWGLVQALEAKDVYAKTHSENVMHYSVGIAETMELGPKHIEIIQRAAMLHDIGKIGIPDAVLFKPNDLTPHERALVEQHPLIGVRILEKMSFLDREVVIIKHHHEKWNGQGYPDRLTRTAIPLGARIIAVADIFDALTATRAYHAARTISDALGMLTDSAGYELDPEVVRAMGTWLESIARQVAKPVEDLVQTDLLEVARQRQLTTICAIVEKMPVAVTN
jgi:diguanylate cyclase (GGDEF)-like protein/putative nucleotidyltransferase with HDIG domain